MKNPDASRASYIIKRSPDFTRHGVLVKRNSADKCYSETVITSTKRQPASCKFIKKDDLIFVAQKGEFVYAKGLVTRLGSVIELRNPTEVFDHVRKHANIRSQTYWFDKLERLVEKQRKDPETVIRYQEYFINQKLLDRTIPLGGPLNRLSKSGMAQSIVKLEEDEVAYLNNPPRETVNGLESQIPSRLRMDVFSLFNKEYAVSHWIDIDHFVPQSVGGPGNIIENLVPIGFSLNRYKSNAVPKALFERAIKKNLVEPKEVKKFLDATQDFLRPVGEFRDVSEVAKKITDAVRKLDINEARSFYSSVLKRHHSEYVEIIQRFNTENG